MGHEYINEMKEFHESLNYFSDENLYSFVFDDRVLYSARVILSSFEYVMYKYGIDDIYMQYYYKTVVKNARSIVADLIICYEALKKYHYKNSIVSYRTIGVTKGARILQRLYELSDGKYDPEPNIRIGAELARKCDPKYTMILNAIDKEMKETGSNSIKYDRLKCILDDAYKG